MHSLTSVMTVSALPSVIVFSEENRPLVDTPRLVGGTKSMHGAGRYAVFENKPWNTKSKDEQLALHLYCVMDQSRAWG